MPVRASVLRAQGRSCHRSAYLSTAKKPVIGLAVLIFIGTCLVCRFIPGAMIGLGRRFFALQGVQASLPLILYTLVGLSTLSYLREVPPDAQQMEAGKHQSASLTLAGFCFTSLSLLVSFFKEAIK